VRSREEAALRGADASHAWVAVWCGEQAGWVQLDPTNDLVAKEDHVAVAWGRDFSDVSPLRGVILGGESHSYGVAVTLVPTT
jgi:transglutaminase-like putative cysteine protease